MKVVTFLMSRTVDKDIDYIRPTAKKIHKMSTIFQTCIKLSIPPSKGENEIKGLEMGKK